MPLNLPSISSVMDLFRSTPAAPQQTPVPGVQSTGNGLPNTQQTGQTGPNGVIPKQEEAKSDPNDPQSLLAQHAKVWETPVVDPKTAPKDIFEGFDPKKVMDATSKVDFSGVVTPELLTQINGGGAEATKAFAQAMQLMGQNTLGRSTIATKSIVEQALKAQREEFEAKLPGLVKQAQVSSNLAVDNPLLSNPALQPVVSALQHQLALKNPEATTAQIQADINSYFGTLGQVFAPKPEPTVESKRDKVYDFSTFLPKSPN